jgi:NADH-ubiquinone oxidoreductase chain 2
MIIISLLILIIPYFLNKFTPVLFTRLSSILIIYVIALSLNFLYIDSVYSSICKYSGLYHVT